jgi:hypothetical protein
VNSRLIFALLVALTSFVLAAGPVPLNPPVGTIPQGQFFPWALDLQTGRFYWTMPLPGERAGVHSQLVGTVLGRPNPSTSDIFSNDEINRFIVGGGQRGPNGVEVNDFQSFSSRTFHENRSDRLKPPANGPPRTLAPDGQRRMLEAAAEQFGELRNGTGPGGTFPYSSVAAKEQGEWANPTFQRTLDEVNAQTRNRIALRTRFWDGAKRVGGKLLQGVAKGLDYVGKAMTIVDGAAMIIAGVGLTIVAIDRARTQADRMSRWNDFRERQLAQEIQKDTFPQLRNQQPTIKDPDGKVIRLPQKPSDEWLQSYERTLSEPTPQARQRAWAMLRVLLMQYGDADDRRPPGACP